MRAAGSTRAFLYGTWEGGAAAVLLGSTFPEQVRGLVLISATLMPARRGAKPACLGPWAAFERNIALIQQPCGCTTRRGWCEPLQTFAMLAVCHAINPTRWPQHLLKRLSTRKQLLAGLPFVIMAAGCRDNVTAPAGGNIRIVVQQSLTGQTTSAGNFSMTGAVADAGVRQRNWCLTDHLHNLRYQSRLVAR